jgi:hypothetical protein
MTRRLAIAVHEATHAVIAQKMGLRVVWVSIENSHDEGIDFTAAVKLADENLDMKRDRHAVLVAMAAPSFFNTYDKDVDRYADLEARLAYEIARRNGIDPGDVYDDAATFVPDLVEEIMDLTELLEDEGRVVFQTLANGTVIRDRQASPGDPTFRRRHVFTSDQGERDDASGAPCSKHLLAVRDVAARSLRPGAARHQGLSRVHPSHAHLPQPRGTRRALGRVEALARVEATTKRGGRGKKKLTGS